MKLRQIFARREEPVASGPQHSLPADDLFSEDDLRELDSQPRDRYHEGVVSLLDAEPLDRSTLPNHPAPNEAPRPLAEVAHTQSLRRVHERRVDNADRRGAQPDRRGLQPPRRASDTGSSRLVQPTEPGQVARSAHTSEAIETQRDAATRPLLHEPASPRAPEVVPIDAADREDYAQTQLAEQDAGMIGEMLIRSQQLTREQVEAVLAHQQAHRCRFGESAVSLGYLKGPEVMWALSRQFGYDYAPSHSVDGAEFSDELVIAKHPFSQAAEVVRDLRSQLLQGVLNPDAVPRRALALVSPDSGDGKTWFAANLAVSLSQLGARTLLIDANLRNPGLHRVFGLDDPKTGLSGILSRRHRADVLRPLRELPHLHLLPAGVVPPNPLEILQGRGFSELLARLRSKFTHVIVDTPALGVGADARLIAARSGASVLIGRRHKSRIDLLQQAARHLSKGDAQFAGLVINDF